MLKSRKLSKNTKYMLDLNKCKSKLSIPTKKLSHKPQMCTISTVWVRLFVQFAFHTFRLVLDTDYCTFAMGRAHYSHLILHEI